MTLVPTPCFSQRFLSSRTTSDTKVLHHPLEYNSSDRLGQSSPKFRLPHLLRPSHLAQPLLHHDRTGSAVQDRQRCLVSGHLVSHPYVKEATSTTSLAHTLFRLRILKASNLRHCHFRTYPSPNLPHYHRLLLLSQLLLLSLCRYLSRRRTSGELSTTLRQN